MNHLRFGWNNASQFLSINGKSSALVIEKIFLPVLSPLNAHSTLRNFHRVNGDGKRPLCCKPAVGDERGKTLLTVAVDKIKSLLTLLELTIPNQPSLHGCFLLFPVRLTYRFSIEVEIKILLPDRRHFVPDKSGRIQLSGPVLQLVSQPFRNLWIFGKKIFLFLCVGLQII